MSALANPYVLKIHELNKELYRLKIEKSVIEYDLNEYKCCPVPTVCLDLIKQDLQKVINQIKDIEVQILKVSKFIR
ncbi:MAG: hypothetical protein IE891_01110 [Flavobacteriaceae bacterium]|nr:hypothetical protein [Flavobacteriaceae bacterium]